MAIEFECPACDAPIRVSEKAIGKKGRCPKCGVLLLVPDPDDFEDDEDDIVEEENVATEENAVEEPEPEPAYAPVDEPVFISVDRGSDSSESIATPADVDGPEIVIDATSGQPHDSPEVVETPPPADEPQPASVPAAASPAAYDPDNPFAFAGSSTAVSRSTYHRRRRRSSMSTRAKISLAAAGCGVIILGVGFWVLYTIVSPDLSGPMTGERFKDVTLPPVSFAAPAKGVTEGDAATVMEILTNEGLPIRSEYIDVRLSAEGGQPQIRVGPGPKSRPVRVSLAGHADVQEVMAKQRDAILKVKQQELRTATAGLFRDYAAYVDDGTPIAKLPEYRDTVGLNAAVGATGYAVEAVVSGHPFLCAYEDVDGNCYFFLPEGVATFQLRGRKLADGTTPLPVDFNVTLVDAKTPVVAEADDSPDGDDAAKPDDESDEKADDKSDDESKPSKDDPKSEEMQDKPPADKPDGDAPESSDGE